MFKELVENAIIAALTKESISEETLETINDLIEEGYDLDDVVDAIVESELEEGSIKGSGTDRKAQLKKAYRAGEQDTRQFNTPGGQATNKPKRGSDAGVKNAYQAGRKSGDGSSTPTGKARQSSQDSLKDTDKVHPRFKDSKYKNKIKHDMKMMALARSKPRG